MKPRVVLGAFLGLGWLASCAPSPSHTPATLGNGEQAQVTAVGIRRLTNREFVRSAEGLLQAPLPAEFAASLPPDVRQEDGYTRNREQTMSPALAVKLAEELPRLVDAALSDAHNQVFTCKQKAGECVHHFVEATLSRAFRRTSDATEVNDFEQVFNAAAATGTPQDGAVAVLCAVLQSPRLWYVTEQGEPEPGSERRRAIESLRSC